MRFVNVFFPKHTGSRILGQILVVWWTGFGSPQLNGLFTNQVVHKAKIL